MTGGLSPAIAAMREQDARDKEIAEKALHRFCVLSGAADGYPEAEEKAYVIGYKDCLRSTRGDVIEALRRAQARIQAGSPGEHGGSMLPHSSASDCRYCESLRAIECIEAEIAATINPKESQ